MECFVSELCMRLWGLMSEGPTSSRRPPRSLGSTQPIGTSVPFPVTFPVAVLSGVRPLLPSVSLAARANHRTSSLSADPDTRDVERNGGILDDGRATANVIAYAVHRSTDRRRTTLTAERKESMNEEIGLKYGGLEGRLVGG